MAIALGVATLPAAQVVPESARGGGFIFANFAGWLVEAFAGSGDGFSGSGDGFFAGSEAGFSGSTDGFSGSGAGGGLIGNVDGVGGEAMFYRPGGVVVGSDGTIYVSDTGNNVIRKIAADGTVTKLAGNFLGSADGGFQGSADGGFLGSSDGIFSGSADGAREAAGFKNPQGLALDKAGNILVADRKNHAIRKVTPDGVVTTIAGSFSGSGTEGLTGSSDGVALEARFNHPSDVAVDSDGNIFVADAGNHAIRKIDTNGNVTTIAGSIGKPGAGNGSGSSPRFNSPQGIAIDANGNIIVADTTNGLIRKIDGNGTVTTIAGALFTTNAGAAFEGSGGQTFTGSEGEGGRSGISGAARDYFTGSMDAFSGSADAFLGSADIGWPQSVDGTGDQARFSFPADVEVDGDGNIYVVDSGSGKIRKITPGGVVSTIGGTPEGFFYTPLDIAISSSEALIVADSGNNRVAQTISNAKPIITLVGNNSLTAYVGGVFNDLGATVTDDYDAARTISGIGSVNTSVLGNYTLIYSAEDSSGLDADSVTRTVQVIYDPQGDLDGDGLTNAQEQSLGTDPTHFDSDLDGYTDKDEVDAKSNPLSADSTPSARSISFSSISSQLIGVKKITSIKEIFNGVSYEVFFALKNTGSVIVWGKHVTTPNSVIEKISSEVIEIINNGSAVAALKSDGSVVTWGDSEYGGNSLSVADKLSSDVSKIVAFHNSFAALKSDGSVVVWGNDEQINNWSNLSSELASGVEDLIGDDFGNYTSNGFSSNGNYYWFYLIAKKTDNSEVLLRENGLFRNNAILHRMTISGNAANMELLDDGSLVQIWGGIGSENTPDWPDEEYIPFDSVKNFLDSPVVFLSSSYAAFAALTETGKVVTWGNGAGADSSKVASELQSGVVKIINGAWTQWFLALKNNGSVVLWGDTGNNTQMANPNTEIRNRLKEGVVDVETTSIFQAITALKSDGSVVVWGDPKSGGDAGSAAQYLNSGVSKLFGSGNAFAAMKSDGSVVTWGSPDTGGDSSKVAAKLGSGVKGIYPVWDGFYAIKDNEVVAWGKTVAETQPPGGGSQPSQGPSGGGGGAGSSQVQKSKKGKGKSSSANKSSGGSKKSSAKKSKSGSSKKDKGSKSSGNQKSGGKKKSKM